MAAEVMGARPTVGQISVLDMPYGQEDWAPMCNIYAKQCVN